jgi:hypothetical protein
MDQVVMETANQQKIVQAGFATVQPMPDVVPVQKSPVRAAREATAAVPQP